MDVLLNYSLKPDALESFSDWYDKAKMSEQNPEAMTLSTIDGSHNRPNARTVLFKGLTPQKELTFYTNYLSLKSQELDKNPEACLLFYWHVSKKQVRVQGKVRRMPEEDSRKYFHSRDRDSQLASYISVQSSPIEDKEALLEKLKKANLEFQGREIPLPSHWGGYLFEPYEFEFFLYGEYRLNDRFLYVKNQRAWDITRLQP